MTNKAQTNLLNYAYEEGSTLPAINKDVFSPPLFITGLDFKERNEYERLLLFLSKYKERWFTCETLSRYLNKSYQEVDIMLNNLVQKDIVFVSKDVLKDSLKNCVFAYKYKGVTS